MNRFSRVTLSGAILFFAACAAKKNAEPEVVVLVPDAGQMGGSFYVDFVDDIGPLLESRCLECHNTYSGITSLSFEKREHLVAQNNVRRLVIPGEPERSSLFLVTVIPEHFSEAMPAEGHRLDKGDTWLIYQWILQGAEWPEEAELRAPDAPPKKKEQEKPPRKIPDDVI